MEFRVLGAFEVLHEGEAVDLGGFRSRSVVATLLVSANRVVPADRLADAIWADDPPDGAAGNLRAMISRLRAALGPNAERLVTQAPGYLFRVEPDELDAERFDRLLDEGAALVGAGRAADGARVLRDALGLWTGPALAEFTALRFARAEAARLDELHLRCLELRIEADLAAGKHAEVIGELEALTHEHPLREQLWALRMLALYRAGRQVEALQAFQAFRADLIEHTGVEPGPALRELEAAILRQDPTLRPGPVVAPPPPPAPDAITVMLVDDHPMWRDALRTVLEARGMVVVAEADDASGAPALAATHRPDVVLMDLHLPGGSGAAAARTIVDTVPRTRVLMLSSSEDDADVLDAVRAGAVGYLVKTGAAAEIVDAVRRARDGDAVFTPALATRVLGELRSPSPVTLPERQRSILRLLSRGMTYDEVGTELGVAGDEVAREMRAALAVLQGTQRGVRSVVFVDVVGSTETGARLGDDQWKAVVLEFHRTVASAVTDHHGVLVRTMGDGALAVFEDPELAVAATLAMHRQATLVARAGIHAGECELADGDVHGIAVNIASRVGDLAGPGETLVSQTVRDLTLGSALVMTPRGTRTLRGVPGTWALYAVQAS